MATNKVFCSYQEVIDLHTEADKVSAIGIHTPVGTTPHKMFSGFYDQFKKYKYLGCDVSLVPAARLPVDPLGVSYEAGEYQIDPRDLLNPIMFHGCHGEDLGNILNSLYTYGSVGNVDIIDQFDTDSLTIRDFANVEDQSATMTLLENLYYKALTDNSWKKAHPQKGFRKGGLRPLLYKVAATHQLMPSDAADIMDMNAIDNGGVDGLPTVDVDSGTGKLTVTPWTSKQSFNLLTNRLTSLGWMDTRTPFNNATNTASVITPENPEPLGDDIAAVLNQKSHLSQLPGIFMGLVLLPPAYKTKQYFRMVLNHRFVFAGFRSMSFRNFDVDDAAPAYFNEDFQEGE